MTMKCDSRMVLLALAVLALYVHGEPSPHNIELLQLQRAIDATDTRLDIMDYRLGSVKDLSADVDSLGIVYEFAPELNQALDGTDELFIFALKSDIHTRKMQLADAEILVAGSQAVLDQLNMDLLVAEQRADLLGKISTDQYADIAKLQYEQSEIESILQEKLMNYGKLVDLDTSALGMAISDFVDAQTRRTCFGDELMLNLTDGEANAELPGITSNTDNIVPIVYCAISGILSTIDEDTSEPGSSTYDHYPSKRQTTGFSVDCYYDSDHDEYHVSVTDQSQSELGLNKALSVTVQYYVCSLFGQKEF